jgi:hypothetical protein
MSLSCLKLILKVTSVKWKDCNIYCWPYCTLGDYWIIMIIIHREIYHERKGIELYGKSNYYLICSKNLVGGCGL